MIGLLFAESELERLKKIFEGIAVWMYEGETEEEEG